MKELAMAAGSAMLQSRLKRMVGVVAATAVVGAGAVACGSSGGTVTREFAQWWGAELPSGSLDKIMSDFTAQNPTIKVKLLSAPYASTKQQLVSGAASRTLPDVVGLD